MLLSLPILLVWWSFVQATIILTRTSWFPVSSLLNTSYPSCSSKHEADLITHTTPILYSSVSPYCPGVNGHSTMMGRVEMDCRHVCGLGPVQGSWCWPLLAPSLHPVGA